VGGWDAVGRGEGGDAGWRGWRLRVLDGCDVDDG